MAMLMSAMNGVIGKPATVKVSPNGITAQTRNDGTKIRIGASRNTNRSAGRESGPPWRTA